MIWPLCSPDLNPIENLWAALKTHLYKQHPHLLDTDLKEERLYTEMERCIQDAWDSLDPNYLYNYIGSMKDRCQAVIDAGGWHTKY